MGNKIIDINNFLQKSLNSNLDSFNIAEKLNVLYEEIIDLDKLHDNIFSFYTNAISFANDSKEKIGVIQNEFTKMNNSFKFYYGSDASIQHSNLYSMSQHLDNFLNNNFFDNPNDIVKIAETFNETLIEQKHKLRISLLNEAINKINNQNLKKREIIDEITIYDDINTIVNNEIYKHQNDNIVKFNDKIGFSYEHTPYKTTKTYNIVPFSSNYDKGKLPKKYMVKTIDTFYCSEIADEENYAQVEGIILNIEKQSGEFFLEYDVSKIVNYNG